MSRILVVDDDADLRTLLSMRLRSAGHSVEAAASGEEALGRLEVCRPHLLITDLRMGGMDGMALFDAVRRRAPSMPVIVLTAHGTIPDAVQATQRGVNAYLTKPFDSATLLSAVAEALQIPGAPAILGDDEGQSGQAWRRDILTQSPPMEALLERARLVAETQTNILIQGESGTGKELLAKAIHRASRRSGGPFVPVNCAAIPEHLLESELFGHKKGSFTGAVTDKRGLLAEASGGTLFLDEVGDMPLPFQAKLLRALQEGEVRPVGATRPVPVDLRVVSATHRDIEQEIAAGRFRADLRYRLEVVPLYLPPLTERPEDIPLLARRFLRTHAARNRRDVKSYAPEAIALLAGAKWPGNIRQLDNVVQLCVALCTGSVVSAALVRDALRDQQATLPTLEEVRTDAERNYLIRLLRITEGNVSQVARLAGRNRTEFYKLLSRHGLNPEDFRTV